MSCMLTDSVKLALKLLHTFSLTDEKSFDLWDASKLIKLNLGDLYGAVIKFKTGIDQLSLRASSNLVIFGY